MLIDLHVHTSAYSACSRIPPRSAVDRAVALDLSGIALTEHGRFWPGDTWRDLSAYAEAKGILLVNGAEYRCRLESGHGGDWLVFGVDELPPAGLPAADLIAAVHSAGGIVIPAHPYRAGLSIPEESWTLPFDAVEAANGNQTPAENRASLGRARERRLPAVGGSDAHTLDEIGRYGTEFGSMIRTAGDLVAAIRSGRCAPWDGRAAPSRRTIR